MAYPTKFTLASASASVSLAVPQGVAFNPGQTLFWGTDKTPGAGSTVRRIFEYDADYNLLRQSGNFDPADGLPADLSQINGITWWDGKLYVGYNNYPNDPKLGGIIVVDPVTFAIDAIHPAGNGHVEGCTIRETQRGVEVFVFSNTGTTIERYDLATWTLQGTHDFGHWSVADDQAVYQGGGWIGDHMCLALHGNQPRPQTIDVCRWDDDSLAFTPFARLEKPTPYCGQGFNFTPDLTQSVHAERNIIPTPDEYRIVRATVSSVDVLPYEIVNEASEQLEDLQYWFQRLAWNAGATEWRLPDTQGNVAAGVVADETHVYPTVAEDGTRKIHFDGEDGASIPLGNLLGAGWAQATIWMRGVVVHRDDANDILMSFDGTGSLLGDGVLEVNRTTARTLTFRYTNAVGASVTLTTPVAVFTLGVPFDPCFVLEAAGARIYVNGALVASNSTPGQIGGANQACYLGSNLLGQAGAQFDAWDIRIYDAVKDPTELATFDSWIEETMGTLSSYARNALVGHFRNKAAYSPAATHYAAAFVAGVEVSGNSYARVGLTNNTTTWPNAASRVKSNGVAFTFPNATGSWGTIDEIRIFDHATAGNELARHTLAVPVAINGGTGPLTIPINDIDITANAGCLTDTVVHELLNLMFGAVANTPRATVHGTYVAGNPQSGGSETSAARTANTQASVWGTPSSGIAISAAAIALADEADATHYAEYSAGSGGTLLFSAQLPVDFTPPVGGIIPAGGLRTSLS